MPLEPLPMDCSRVLSVSAHPDDSEFFAGGALAQFAAGGSKVALVVCTDGRRGGRDLDEADVVRSREQAAAASQLGAHEVVELGFVDGQLEAGDALRGHLIEAIRRFRPDVVLGHDPRTFFQKGARRARLGHSDHRAAGTALLDAVYPRAGNPNFEPGRGGAPWRPREVWLFDSAEPDFMVDVTDGYERKISALEAHASQHAAGGGLIEAARRAGRFYGDGERLGEAFVRLVLA